MRYLIESSLSRIFQFIEEKNRSFGVVSAFRGDLPNDENIERHNDLKVAVRGLGLGFVEMRGGYKGDQGFVTELSLFVPSISKQKLIALGQKYNQHSVLFKDADEFSLIGTNAASGVGTVMSGFKFGVGKDNIELAQDAMKEFFSSLLKGTHKGRKFLFKMEEKTILGFFDYAYGKDKTSKWFTICEETE